MNNVMKREGKHKFRQTVLSCNSSFCCACLVGLIKVSSSLPVFNLAFCAYFSFTIKDIKHHVESKHQDQTAQKDILLAASYKTSFFFMTLLITCTSKNACRCDTLSVCYPQTFLIFFVPNFEELEWGILV